MNSPAALGLALALAGCKTPDIIQAMTRAQDNKGGRRVEYLRDAQRDCAALYEAISAAIAHELGANAVRPFIPFKKIELVDGQ